MTKPSCGEMCVQNSVSRFPQRQGAFERLRDVVRLAIPANSVLAAGCCRSRHRSREDDQLTARASKTALPTLRKSSPRPSRNKSNNRLPTSKSGDQWWVDPIVGLRGQINFTRWLFLALQGDVGGFGAGSQIAWFASGSIGVNLTRNIFLETGYRYFYMDYTKNGLTYDAAQSGLFTGVGVKF